MDEATEQIRGYLHMPSVQELEAGRYGCRRCERDWRYRDDPYWWRCPTSGCAEWMSDSAPAVQTARRILSGSRPLREEASAPAQRRRRGGRPRGPKVPLHVITETHTRMKLAYGDYPPDADLADELGVSRRTILNWRRLDYLPQRPTQ